MQQKTMLEILDETVAFYGANVQLRGQDPKGGCMYITPDGRSCAVGRCMSLPTREMRGGVAVFCFVKEHAPGDGAPFQRHISSFEDELKPEYRGHPIAFWERLQELHDDSTMWGETIGLSDKGQGFVEILNQIILNNGFLIWNKKLC